MQGIIAMLLACARVASAHDIYVVTDTNVLVRFSSTAPGTFTLVTAITGLGIGETLLGIDFRLVDRELYALTHTASGSARLYRLAHETGVATLIGTLAADPAQPMNPFTALSGTHFALDFNPTVDRLRVVSDDGMNIRVNPNTALVLGDTNLNPGTPHVVGIAYSESYAGSRASTLYDIDSSLDTLSIQYPTNGGVLTTVGLLNYNTGDRVGFDILTLGAVNTGYATLSVGGIPSLFTINLGTGAGTYIGGIGGGLQIAGMAVFPDTIFRNGFD